MNKELYLEKLNIWKEKCELHNRDGELAYNLILQTRFSLANYDFESVDKTLEKTENLIPTIESPFKKNLILETLKLQENKDRIEQLVRSNNLLREKDKNSIIDQYIKEVVYSDLLKDEHDG